VDGGDIRIVQDLGGRADRHPRREAGRVEERIVGVASGEELVAVEQEAKEGGRVHRAERVLARQAEARGRERVRAIAERARDEGGEGQARGVAAEGYDGQRRDIGPAVATTAVVQGEPERPPAGATIDQEHPVDGAGGDMA